MKKVKKLLQNNPAFIIGIIVFIALAGTDLWAALMRTIFGQHIPFQVGSIAMAILGALVLGTLIVTFIYWLGNENEKRVAEKTDSDIIRKDQEKLARALQRDLHVRHFLSKRVHIINEMYSPAAGNTFCNKLYHMFFGFMGTHREVNCSKCLDFKEGK